MNYLTISCDMDGDVRCSFFSEEELTERLNEQYWGDDVRFLTQDEIDGDPQYWPGDNVLAILRNPTVVVPETVSVAWRLP
jgi:hypothetical protein